MPARSSIGEDPRVYALKLALLVAVYYGAAKGGLSLASMNPSISAVWPPTGIALPALIFWGYRMWPAVLVGAFLANNWTGVPLYAVAGIAIGNTGEALCGAFLLRRVADFRPDLQRVRDVVALAFLAGIVSTLISAIIGVASLRVADHVSAREFWTAWRTWWLGDMGGDLVVAPAIMVAITHWPYRRAPGRAFEAVAACAAVAGAAFVAFYFEVPRAFIVFPFMIWATLRFWQPGAVAASLIVAAFAIPFTVHDRGSFSGLSLDDRLQLAQTFVGVVSISALILAAVMTERQRIEDAARYISETLQRGLLPANLPKIPGVETAVKSRPAGEGELVSGDFYEWFETTRGHTGWPPGVVSSSTRHPGSFGSGARSWDVMLGDIGGKGAAAARTTALARYTLRADAVHEDRPSHILGLLNGALRRQAPGETCTVAYGRLILRPDGRAELTLSLAGHPLPLVVRNNGAVEQLGSAGNPLGAMADPLLSDHRAVLDPGDAVLLYTDGLTDAYAPGHVVSQEELTEVLTSCAGCDAAEIATGVQRVVPDGDGAGPRDDITVLVLRVAASG